MEVPVQTVSAHTRVPVVQVLLAYYVRVRMDDYTMSEYTKRKQKKASVQSDLRTELSGIG